MDTVYLNPALNYFNEALKIDPDYLDAMAGKSEILLQGSKYDSAMIYSEKILKTDQENPSGLDGKARIYWFNNEIDSAVKYCQKILEVNPNDQWTNLFLGTDFNIFQKRSNKRINFLSKSV